MVTRVAEARQVLDHIHVVLVQSSHPGNVGAAARAMKTMGLTRLRLVAPPADPQQEGVRRASGADDVLAAADTFATLAEAIADCQMVIGTSARARRLPWPLVTVEQAVSRVAQEQPEKVAFVFGRERTGLSNTELQQCHLHMTIPANPDYSSLNLASAVQVCSYEMRRQLGPEVGTEPGRHSRREDPVIAQAELEAMLGHLEEASTAVGFLDPRKPKLLRERLRRLFTRSQLRQSEYQLMRGLCRRILYTAARTGQEKE